MDVPQIADIVDHGHVRIRFLGGELRLRELQTYEIALRFREIVLVRSELGEKERKTLVLEFSAPQIVHELHARFVLPRFGGVRFALVPDYAAHRERLERRDRTTVYEAGPADRFARSLCGLGGFRRVRNPRIDVRAAPCATDYAHRHVYRVMEIDREIRGDGGRSAAGKEFRRKRIP